MKIGSRKFPNVFEHGKSGKLVCGIRTNSNIMSKKQSKSPIKIKLFLVAIFFVAISLSLIQLVLANSLSAKGNRIRELEKQEQQMIYENLKIKNEIARNASLTYIEEQAGRKLGMTKATGSDKIDFVKIREEILALRK